MTVINPIENGLHSLVKALREAHRILTGQSDRYSGKEVILQTHHAVETILKAALIEMNPVFVLHKTATVQSFCDSYTAFRKGENTFMAERTIGLLEALDRLNRFGELECLQHREFDDFRRALKDLETLRNQFQHLGADIDDQRALSVAGSIIPRFLDAVVGLCGSKARTYRFWLEAYQSAGPDFEGFALHLAQMLPEAEEIIASLRRGYDRVAESVVQFFGTKAFDSLALSIDMSDLGAHYDSPEININGFLDIELKSSDAELIAAGRKYPLTSHIVDKLRKDPKTRGIETYAGRTQIERPRLLNEGLFAVDVSFQLKLRLRAASPYLVLSAAAEMLGLLRWIDVTVDGRITCEVTGDPRHGYLKNHKGQPSNVREVTGELIVTVSALPQGVVQPADHLIGGRYSSPLTIDNAFFDLHWWCAPNGDVERPSVRWNSSTIGTLAFS